MQVFILFDKVDIIAYTFETDIIKFKIIIEL